jgi:REP element-mobilizing transposase RayT
MTNHVHLVCRSINSQNPELLLDDLKRFTSQSIVKSIQENLRESRKEFLLDFFKNEEENISNVKHYQFWRHDNKPIYLWSNTVIQQKIDYVHSNPVEEGLVCKPEDYVYSSSIDYARQKVLVVDVIVFRMFGV